MSLSERIRDFFDGGSLAAEHIGGDVGTGHSPAVKAATVAMMALALAGCGGNLDAGPGAALQLAEAVRGDTVAVAMVDRANDRVCTGDYIKVAPNRMAGDLSCRQLSNLPQAERAQVETAVAGRAAAAPRASYIFDTISVYYYPENTPLGVESSYLLKEGEVCHRLTASAPLPRFRSMGMHDVTPQGGPSQYAFSTGSTKSRGSSSVCYSMADAPAAEQQSILSLAAKTGKPEHLALARSAIAGRPAL